MKSPALISLKMRHLLLVCGAVINGTVAAESFRISQVVAEAGDGVEEMVYSSKGHEEKLFVKKEAIVTEADVSEAWADPVQELSLSFNEAGAAKLKAATSGMTPNHDRMAMLVDGKVISAPVVQSVPLSKQLVVTELLDLDHEGLRALAEKIRGHPLPPEVEAQRRKERLKLLARSTLAYVEITEEEHQELKRFREKKGEYYLDAVPTQAELDQSLRQGMGQEEVVKVFGPAKSTTPERMSYRLAPEKRPADDKNKITYPNGFAVLFKDGKAESWTIETGNALRLMKPEDSTRELLGALRSPPDSFAPDFNPIRYLEGIKVPDASRIVVPRAVLQGLATTVHLHTMIAGVKPDLGDEIDPACDVMVLLARYFPEVAELKRNAGQGKLSVHRLGELLAPYAEKKKEVPDPPAKAAEEATPGH